MLNRTRSGHLVDGIVIPVSKSYDYLPDDGAPVAVATMFSDHVQWQPSTFEGPPECIRSFDLRMASHVGRVVLSFAKCERVMSDVWDDVHYATILCDDGEFRDIAIPRGSCTVDASPAILARWEEWKTLDAEWRRRSEARAAAKRAAAEKVAESKRVRKGKFVVVARGRKVPVGTHGRVIWMGESAYGWRVGIKVDGQSDAVWTSASNVEVACHLHSDCQGAPTSELAAACYASRNVPAPVAAKAPRARKARKAA